MKKLLIAIEYNDSAEKIAEAGYAFAKAMNADVTIAHVMTEPAYYAMDYSPIMGFKGGYTNGITDLVEGIKKEAFVFLDRVVKHLANPTIKTVALEGDDIGNTILNFAESCQMDLIVIGSHRHHGLEKLLISDVAVEIVRHSGIPLLIIPTKR